MISPATSLIPRFNLDYQFSDLVDSVRSAFQEYDRFNSSQLQEIFGNKLFIFTNSGRSSLYLILKSLNLPKGSKIGVPIYSCTVVFDAIIKSGHIPFFLDIDLENYTLDPHDLENKIDDLAAVIVIHTFGRPADMDEIKKVSSEIPVIEDCAHSLLSEYKGELTGTIGSASFFSFKKYISAGGGGMVILNNDECRENLLETYNSLGSPSKLDELGHSFKTYIHSFLYHKPWFGIFFPIGSYLDKKISSNNGDFSASMVKRSDLAIFLEKLKRFREKVEVQRRHSKILLDELRDTPLVLPLEKRDTWCNYYLFPVLFDDEVERERAHKDLRKQGVDTAKLYSRTPHIAEKVYGYKGDCQNSEVLSDTVLTIPNYYSLSEDDLVLIAKSIRKVCG